MSSIKHENFKKTAPFPVMLGSWDQHRDRYYYAPHWHQAIEVNFVQSGHIQNFQILNQHFTLQAGDILVVNPRQIHSVKTMMDDSDRGLVILYPYDYVAGLFPRIDQSRITINDPRQFTTHQAIEYANLQNRLTKLNIALNHEGPYRNLMISTLLAEILQRLLTDFTVKEDRRKVDRAKEYQTERLLILTQMINDHYQQRLKLDDLAARCGLSKEYLTRFFKRLMGITIGEYINNVRAQNAYQELCQQSKSLMQLALDNGFSGIRTMNRTFARVYGQTASQLKQSLHKKGQ